MKPNAIILIGVIIIFLMGTLTGCFIERKFIAQPCLELIKTDTVRVVVYDSATVKTVVKSKAKKVKKAVIRKILTTQIDTIHCDTLRLITRELITLADTSFYSDTLRNDTSYHIVIQDTIVGHRLGLGVEFKNLRPLVQETITRTVVKKKQWVIYGCVQIPISKNYISAIPTVNITTPVGFSFGYGYEPRRNEHIPQIGYSIRFNQK